MNRFSYFLHLFLGFFLFWLGIAVLIPQWDIPPLRLMVNLITLLDFGIHEMGHMVFGIFGIPFLGVLGGSLFQWSAPILMAGYAVYKKWLTWAIFFFFWFGITIQESAPYIKDASNQKLPLSSPFFFTGEPITHDWNYLLSQTHLLWADQIIGILFFIAGSMVMLLAVALMLIPKEWIVEWEGWSFMSRDLFSILRRNS